ncbi:MAG: hypothetical protein R3A10_19470 [Caldilineaceae bacterium]
MSTQADTPVKGSWEALLQQANAYAANYNDEAIPLFEKIYTRLQKMPRAQRHAANQRLQNIYMQAAINLHAYLIMRERYDEGMAIIPAIEEEMGPDETTRWEIHAAQLLKQQGRDDDAVARLRALAEKPESDLDVWGELGSMLVQLRRFDAADAVIARMDEWVAEHHDADTDARRRDAAAVASLRASAALRRREWEEAGRWLDTAADLDEEFGRRRILLPVELLRAGEFKLADRFRPSCHHANPRPTARRSLWKQGETARAEAIWQEIIDTDLDEDTPVLSEMVLANYYLGDKRPSSAPCSACSAKTPVRRRGASIRWPGWDGPSAATSRTPKRTWRPPCSSAGPAAKVGACPTPPGTT